MAPTPLTSRAAGWVIFILALGAGFSVASIYYAQPLLPLMGANLHLSVEGMGLVPTLTQAGYAVWGASVQYRINRNWSAALNVHNLFDKTYYKTVGTSGSGNWYGEPRSVLLTLRGAF